MKKCGKCSIEKNYEDFYKDKYSKDGYKRSCKECNKIYVSENIDKRKEYQKEYSKKSQKRKDYIKKYKEENKNIILLKRKLRYEENKEKELLKQKEYYQENKEYINERAREKYHSMEEEDRKLLNKSKSDKNIEYRREYYQRNRDELINNQRDYYQENKEEISKYREQYKPIRNYKRRIEYKYKIENDSLFHLKENIRSSIRRSFKLKNLIKNSKTNEVLGCTFKEFKLYLESKFESWMNWDNYGKYNGELNHGWDIDHIIPISSAKNEEDILKLNHYTNLQPLCSYTNRVIKKDIL